MSYTKQTWANGDTITAEKLNHMESGIEGAGVGLDGIIFYGEGYSNPKAIGNFNSAKEKLTGSNKSPIVVVGFMFSNLSTYVEGSTDTYAVLSFVYDADAPDRIIFPISSTMAFAWTAEGVELVQSE